jgi:hypothetical protein
MSNRRNYIPVLIVIAISVVALITYLYIRMYTPKYDWETNYRIESKQPYGIKLLYDVLKADYTDKFIEINSIPSLKINTNDVSSLYIFINAHFYSDSIEVAHLANFARKGNVVFVSAQNLTYDFIPYLSNQSINYFETSGVVDSTIKVRFNNVAKSEYRFDYKYNKGYGKYFWEGIDTAAFNEYLSVLKPEAVSYIKDTLINCLRIPCGKGWVIVHFNPIFFTNFNYCNEDGLNYVNQLFSSYSIKQIYWDEYSKSDHYSKDGAAGNQESVFRYIFSQKSLKWSWFMIIGITLLFLIFNIKRRYPVVPLLPENKNTTLEYTHAIAMLHYQYGNVKFMADEILKQFFVFVKNKYGITKGEEPDYNAFAQVVSKSSGISPEKIIGIFLYHKEILEAGKPDNTYFIDLYKSTDYFYKNCK